MQNQRWKYQIYLFKIWSYKFLFVCRNKYAILFAATHVHMPKIMLPATHISCLKDTHTNAQINVGIGISYFLGILQLVCKNQRWKYQICLFKIWSYKFLFLHRNWYKILLALTRVCMPKMMLPAIQTSCLKDSHTNSEKYVGIGTRYFGDSLSLYLCRPNSCTADN